MNFNRRHFLAATGAAVTLPWSLNASAKLPGMMRVYVGFPAGTTPDVLVRKVGEQLVSQGVVQSVVVDNKLGAGGQLAVASLKNMPGDGSHVLLTPMSMLGVFPHTYSKLPYDPVADVTPVSMGAVFDYGIAVGPAVPESVKNINDLMNWYKANPTKANIGSPSTGSTLHFTSVMLGRAAGVEITHVGYKGSSFAIQDMLGGTLPAVCAPLGAFLNQPGLRVLATTGAKRSPFTPNAATLAESGFKDLVFSEWYGFFLPGKASPAAVQELQAALEKVLMDKDIVSMLATFGMESRASTPQELQANLDQDLKRWGDIVKSIGFKADA